MGTKAQSISFLLSQVRNTSGPLTGGKVYFYAAGTSTAKTVWQDRNKATPAANPYTLDGNATAQLYGDGLYRIVIKTSALVTVYDRDNIAIKDASGLAYDVADYSSLAAAVASIGSTPATLQYATDQTLAANLTIPSTLKLMPLNGAVINLSGYTLTITPGATDHVTPSMFGSITYGTSASAGEQTANTTAFNAAVSVAAASNLPCKVGAGTILVNDNIVSASPVSIIGDAATPTRMLQTAAGKYVFYLGTSIYGSFTYGYRVSNLHLASAAGAAGNVYLGNIINSFFDNITMSGAGVYGWTIEDCQELTFRNCPNSGYYRPLIAGQNTTGSSNGVWGDGVTTGAAWRITGATTTILLDGVDISVARVGIINDATDLHLTWYGTTQGLIGSALDDQSGMVGFDINIYSESGGASSTLGGMSLSGANHGRIHYRNADVNGLSLTNGCSGIHISGLVNRIDVDSTCTRITGNNIALNSYGNGYLKDLSLDGAFTNVVGITSFINPGTKPHIKPVSIFPNRSLERWDGTTAPCGLAVYNGATISKTGTALADTTKYSGDYAVKIVGGAGNSTGLRYLLGPMSLLVGRYVTVRGWHNSAEDWLLWYQKSGGAATYALTVKASGGGWAPFSATIKIASDDTGGIILFSPLATKTIYLDDINIETESFDVALPQTLGTTTTPSVAVGGGSAPVFFWKAANGTPVNITNFTGGYGGQEYTFLLDDNTTLKNGATMKLRGAADKTGAGNFIKLIYDSENAIWYQSAYESDN